MCKKLLVVVVAIVVHVTAVSATDSRIALRSFDRFELDPENASGLWVEVGAATVHDEASRGTTSGNSDVVTTGLRLAYGGSLGEVGLFLPYHFLSLDVSSFAGTQKLDEDGVGDLKIYGRWTPLHNEWGDAGIGLELQIPTGNEDRGLGAGKVGFLPFGTAGVHLGPADLRAHFGYRTFAGADDVYGQTIPPDSLVYGGGLWVPWGAHIAVRAEFLGESIDTHPSITPLVFEPGIDFMWPLDAIDLFIRPTGGVGITDDAPDWSFGGSIAAAWH